MIACNRLGPDFVGYLIDSNFFFNNSRKSSHNGYLTQSLPYSFFLSFFSFFFFLYVPLRCISFLFHSELCLCALFILATYETQTRLFFPCCFLAVSHKDDPPLVNPHHIMLNNGHSATDWSGFCGLSDIADSPISEV